MARKTKYKPEMCEQVKQLAAEGLIDVEIAKQMGIHHDTYYEYQRKYPEFSEAIKSGKKVVDDKVESKLLQRANGYEYEEKEIIINKNGTNARVKKVTKHVAPDVTAQIFWLKNRRPEKWNDKFALEHSGEMGVTIINNVPKS